LWFVLDQINEIYYQRFKSYGGVVGTKELSAYCGTPLLNIEADIISLIQENSASCATKPLEVPFVTKMDVFRHLSLKLNSIS
jgi:hypothetical protein